MIFYTNTGAAKYGYHLLKIFDENIAYPQVVAVRDEDKDSQWVKDLMKAFTSDEQVERINKKINRMYVGRFFSNKRLRKGKVKESFPFCIEWRSI